VSVAYVNRDGDAREVLDAYAAADLPSVRARVTDVTLNAVTRRDRHYEWSPMARIALR
jgi:hypothetical protein